MSADRRFLLMWGSLPFASLARLSSWQELWSCCRQQSGDRLASPTPSLTPTPTDDLLGFQNRTVEQLIDKLMSSSSDVEFHNVNGSTNLADCDTLSTYGRAAVRLVKKNQ